jgi:DNA-binding NarL/FixJ family response regulator
MRIEKRVPCVYLTRSVQEAVSLQHLLAAARVRVYRAASLSEAIVMLRTVKGMVLLVDYSFPGGNWRDALRVVSRQYPESAVVVAAAVRRAAVWEQVFAAGGFEVVLKPFELQEVGPILREADTFSREFFSSSARLAQETAPSTEVGSEARNGGAANARTHCGERSSCAGNNSLLAALSCLRPKYFRKIHSWRS